MLRHTVQLVTVILTFFLPKLMSNKRHLVDGFFKTVLRLVDERGIAFTVKYVKNSRLAVTRYITGHPLSAVDLVSLKDGWPVWLSELKELVSDTDGLRLLMTLLVSLRGVKLKPNLDISPIISPWAGSDSVTEKELRHAARQLGIRFTKVD